MFTARAATRRMVTAESVDSADINVLAGRVRGIASVGLNAIAFVSETECDRVREPHDATTHQQLPSGDVDRRVRHQRDDQHENAE